MPAAPLLLTLAVLAPSGAASVAPSAAGGPGSTDELLEQVLRRAQAELEAGAVVLGDHTTWDAAWEITTRDYAIRTPMNWYLGKQLGDDLEVMLGFFRELGRTEWRPPSRMRVFLFPALADYNAFGDEFGQEHSSMLGSFWARDHAERPVALYFDPNRSLVSMWATHAAFHQFVEQAFPSTPPLWINEGLASYFGIFYWDVTWGAGEFRRVVDSGQFVPLRQLMREPITAYVTPEGSSGESHRRFVQLGALFAYLLNYREDTRTQRNADGLVLVSPAADYVADVLRGRDVGDHPVHELLTLRLDELEADLRAFGF